MLLLRHTGAGPRLSSPYIDRFRELDEAGRNEARLLVSTLGDRKIERVVTSPLARCVQTVAPIAGNRRLPVERRDELLPEAELQDILGLLEELPDASLVCTHREVVLQLFEGEVDCEKGGTLVLERVGSLWSPTEYLAPPGSVESEAFPRFASGR